MPDITIPGWLMGGLNVILAFLGAFGVALWLSMIVWTFRDVRSRSRDVFAVLLATLMVVIFGPLGLLLYFLLRPQVTLAELYERALEEEALLQDLEEQARCSGCSRKVEKHWIVCPDCHTQLKRQCNNCDEKLKLQWNICPSCGIGVSQTTNRGSSSAQTASDQAQFQPRLVQAQAASASESQAVPPPKPTSPPQETDSDWEEETSETRPFRPAETVSE
ncbi:MAG: zinc ribbon domain-containing protein [Chloroflexota bacterium]